MYEPNASKQQGQVVLTPLLEEVFVPVLDRNKPISDWTYAGLLLVVIVLPLISMLQLVVGHIDSAIVCFLPVLPVWWISTVVEQFNQTLHYCKNFYIIATEKQELAAQNSQLAWQLSDAKSKFEKMKKINVDLLSAEIAAKADLTKGPKS